MNPPEEWAQDWNRAVMDAINERRPGWDRVMTHFYDGVLTAWNAAGRS